MKQRNFQMIKTNGVMLRTVVEGSGPLVILLHGFPQCWYLWRHQIDPLVEAGFRVAVPDQRGYGGSDKPAAVEAYNIVELTSDVVGLASALGHDRFIVVGHDLGRNRVETPGLPAQVFAGPCVFKTRPRQIDREIFKLFAFL